MELKTIGLSFVGLIILTACFPVSNTKIYEGNTVVLPASLAILPFVNQTTSQELDAPTLISFQEQLKDELRSLGHFEKVEIPQEGEKITAEAIVQCVFTQFDLGARRVVVKTEVRQPETTVLLKKMVTHSHLVSVIWPLDYMGALSRSTSTVISDIAESLSK